MYTNIVPKKRKQHYYGFKNLIEVGCGGCKCENH